MSWPIIPSFIHGEFANGVILKDSEPLMTTK
jgi:hypothetical protein